MRKLLITNLLFVATCTLIAQQPTIFSGKTSLRSNDFYVVDSLYCYSHSLPGQPAIPTERQYNLAFTEDGEVLQSRREQYISAIGVWQNLALTNYVYDGQNNLVEQTEQRWDTLSLAWVNFKRTQNTPNQNGNFTEVLNQNWLGNAWKNEEKVKSVFNAAGYIETLTQQLWAENTGAWKNNFRIIYATNTAGQFVLTKFQLWNDAGNNFYDVSRTTYTYNAQQLESEAVTEVFNAATTTWGKSSRKLKSYDSSGNLTDETNQLWHDAGDNWLNQSRILQNFNAAHQVTLRTELLWNGTNWVNFFQTNNVFDANGNLTRFEVSQWQTTQWALLTSCDFFWRFHHEVLPVKESLPGVSCLIPNPYRRGSTISCSQLPPNQVLHLAIFDVTGKIRYQEKMNSQNFTNIAPTLPPGLYVLTIRGTDEILFIQKLVVNSQ